jgi:TPR repeat protein
MKRAEANDPALICVLSNHYEHGRAGFQQDHAKAKELYTRAADLGCSKAHSYLGNIYYEGGDLKKAKFHFEAAAMAGHEGARYILGCLDAQSGNIERAAKHLTIAASAGSYLAMQSLISSFEQGTVSRESIDSTLIAYNNSCAEMKSEARDACIQFEIDRI